MSDLIDRQAAIDAAIEATDSWDGVCNIGRQKRIENYINKLPSALGTNLAEVGTDSISRQQAIDAVKSRKTAEQSSAGIMRNAVVDFCVDIIKKLPSAQPEPIKINIEDFNKEDWERFRKEWANTPITVLSAQPKKGRWISADAIFGGVPFYCSECGENTRDTVMGKPRWKFCPMCGAKMEGADDE